MSLLEVGNKFTSYSDVEEAMKNYEEKTFSKFWKRDARLIASSRIQRPIRGQLKYVEIKFCCIYGGQKFRPSGSGQNNSRTFKNEDPCTAHVALRVTPDGRDLEVRSISENHNHERSKILYQSLSQPRRLISKDKEELLALRANKKLVKQKLERETGKCLTLKDLSNIKQRLGRKSENLAECVNILRKKYSAEVHVLKDDKNNFKGIFIQTSNMKNTFSAYPEFLGIDGTYKLINIGIPVFLIIAEDGNCQTEIVAFCLLTNEDKDSFTWFIETFKKINLQTELTKCIMADKDLLEKTVIRDSFPNVNLNICIFQSMRIFNREITCEKMEITQANRMLCLQILQKMVYSKTEDEFERLYNTLKEIAPKSVIEYFDKNWYPIKHEWTTLKSFMKGSFQNTTNNRVESINSKLKSVITKNSTLEEFLRSFFTILSALESERDYKAVYHSQKRQVILYPPESDEKKYLEFLTHESGKMVIEQIECSKKIKINEPQDNCFVINSPEGELRCTANNCNCNFNIGMLLPCRHIFAVRSHLRLPLFSEEIINKRWTLHYYKKNQRCLGREICDESGDESNLETSGVTETLTKPKTYSQKRRQALLTTDSLANLVAMSSHESYKEKMDNLTTIEMLWKEGKKARIVSIEDSDDFSQIIRNFPITTSFESPLAEVTTNIPIEDIPVNVIQSMDVDNIPMVFANDTEVSTNTNISEVAEDAAIAMVTTPPKIKKRGRPKGGDLTAIGMKKKKVGKK